MPAIFPSVFDALHETTGVPFLLEQDEDFCTNHCRSNFGSDMILRRAAVAADGREIGGSKRSTYDLHGHLRLESSWMAAVAVADATSRSLYQRRERGGYRLAEMLKGVWKACLLLKNCSHLVSRDIDTETIQLDDTLPSAGLGSRSNNASLRHDIAAKACQLSAFYAGDGVHAPL